MFEMEQFAWNNLFYMLCIIALYATTSIHILLTKHENPSSALLWLLVILLLPGAGFLFYLFFGIIHLNRLQIRVAVSADKVQSKKNDNKAIRRYSEQINKYRDSSGSIAAGTFNFSMTLDRLFPENTPIGGNTLELLHDGTMAYPHMLEDIRNARQNIHLQSFIIMNDAAGKEIFDALRDKAEEGVQIKVLYDRFGSAKAIFSHFFRKYANKSPNLEIRAFARFNIFTPWHIQLRNHRKLLVIDGKTAFLGGVNISEENTRSARVPKEKYIHDLHCRITGPTVSELQFFFLRDWLFATNSTFEKVFLEEYFPALHPCGNNTVRVIDSGPGQSFEASEKAFFTAAATATQSLWIMTPYFVPEPDFIKMLCMTAARGVEVKVIVPKHNNHFFVDWAAQSLYRTLLRSGVRIFEKRGFFSHAKAMLGDGKWIFMGSSNCDVRSFRLNYELDFAVEKGDFINELHSQFLDELSEADEVELAAVEHKPLPMILAENICALLIPIL